MVAAIQLGNQRWVAAHKATKKLGYKAGFALVKPQLKNW